MKGIPIENDMLASSLQLHSWGTKGYKMLALQMEHIHFACLTNCCCLYTST